MSTCTLFAEYTTSLSRSLASADSELGGSDAAKTPYDSAKLDKLFSILQQYEDHFSRHLKILLDALNYLAATETVVFLGLCARLSMANEGGAGGGNVLVGGFN
jgi:gamma-tubulin complex component 2